MILGPNKDFLNDAINEEIKEELLECVSLNFSEKFEKFCEKHLIFKLGDKDHRILQKEVLSKWKLWGNETYKNFVSNDPMFYEAIRPHLDSKKPNGKVFVNAEWIVSVGSE